MHLFRLFTFSFHQEDFYPTGRHIFYTTYESMEVIGVPTKSSTWKLHVPYSTPRISFFFFAYFYTLTIEYSYRLPNGAYCSF